MTTLRAAAQQALEALEHHGGNLPWNAFVEVRKDLRAALAQEQAEPVEPVAWIHTDPDKPRVKFLEWRENEPGYRGRWDKTPLYTAPPRCPNCASLEAQNDELDRKLAELERAHGIIESEIKVDSHQTLDDAMQQPRAMAQAYESGYNAGVANEREACAKVCESRFMGDLTREDMEARRCAAAIRARGEMP